MKYHRSASGDKYNPYLRFADPIKLETNRDFEVIYVQGIVHQNHVRNGYHIRKAIAPPEVDDWQITVQKKLPKFLKDYRNSTLLVKGSSCDFWLQDTAGYHKELGK